MGPGEHAAGVRQAIPVLLAWLERAETDVPASERQRFREGVVRSLAVTEARGRAGPALLAGPWGG